MGTLINLADKRLIDPTTTASNDGTGGRLRRGAEILRSDVTVRALRAGQHFRLSATDDWNSARCDCSRPVEWNCAGLEWPICGRCLAGALEALAAFDNEGGDAA